MNDLKYELLICIKEYSETFVSKQIIINLLKEWSYAQVNTVLQNLKDEGLVDSHSFDEVEKYSVSSKGLIFIEDYYSNKSKGKKDFFAGYIYPTILFMISTALSIILFLLS